LPNDHERAAATWTAYLLIIGKIPCIRESPRATKDGLRNLIANLGTDRVACHAMVPPFLYAGKIPVIWEAPPPF
jgi:hypothetical protein